MVRGENIRKISASMNSKGIAAKSLLPDFTRWGSDKGMGKRTVSLQMQPLDDFQVRGPSSEENIL